MTVFLLRGTRSATDYGNFQFLALAVRTLIVVNDHILVTFELYTNIPKKMTGKCSTPSSYPIHGDRICVVTHLGIVFQASIS